MGTRNQSMTKGLDYDPPTLTHFSREKKGRTHMAMTTSVKIENAEAFDALKTVDGIEIDELQFIDDGAEEEDEDTTFTESITD